MAFYNSLQRRGRITGRKSPPPTFEYSNIIGVNYSDSIYAMADNQSPFGQNADFGKPIGSITKRDGYEALIPSLGSGKILGLNCWQHSAGDKMLFAWDKYLYLLSGDTGSVSISSEAEWETGTLTDLDSTTTVGSIQLYAGTFNDADTLTADFDGTHSGTTATGDKVTLTSATVTEVTDQSISTSTSQNESLSSSNDVGQTFVTASTTHYLGKIRVKVQSISSAGNVTLTLYDGPDMETTLGSVVKSVSSTGDNDFSFSTPVSVSPSTEYYFELTTSAFDGLLYKSGSNPYASGSLYRNQTERSAEDLTATTYAITPVTGTYTSGVLDPSAQSDACGIKMVFNITTPTGTTAVVQHRISTTSGSTWGSWTNSTSGSLIIAQGVVKTGYRLQYRVTLTTSVSGANPSLDDMLMASTYGEDGEWESPVHDLGNTPASNVLTFTTTEPASTSVTAYARGSSSGVVFGDWLEVATSGDSIPLQRYIQVKFVLATTDVTATPVVSDYLVSYASSYTTANKLDIGPLGRTSDLLTGNRVRFCNYDDWLVMADGLRPFMAYITTGTQTTGTAQAGTKSTITLAAGASAVNDFYNNAFVTTTAGTASGKTRWVQDYVGATKVLTPSEPWSINLLTENQASVETNTTGFTTYGTSTLTRTTAEHYVGSASLQIDTTASGVQGAYTADTAIIASTTYTASVYVKGSGTIYVGLRERDAGGSTVGTTLSPVITLTSSWQRVEVTRAFTAAGVNARIYIYTNVAQATTFYADALQLEEGNVATAFDPWPDATTEYSIGSAVKVRNLGVDPPTTALSAADSGTAGSPNGAYLYKVTYVNADDIESNPSAASASVTVSSKKINLTSIPVDTSTGNTTAKRRIYRTVAGGAVYKYLTEIADNSTTTYQDDTADGSLGSLMIDNNNIPPTVCTLVYEFTSYVFFVDGYDVWYSKAGSPDQVPNITGDIQQIPFPGRVLDIKNHPTALIVSGEDFISTITADGGFIFDSDVTVDTTTSKVIDSNGCLSFEASAVCLSPDMHSTLLLNTNTGIRATVPGLQDDSIESVPLSKNIQPYYERSINRDQSAGCFFNNYYLYSMEHQPADGSDAEYLTFAFDLRTNQWYGPWTFGMSCYETADNVLYAGDNTNGIIYRMYSGSSDNGSAINMIVDLPMRAPAGESGSCKFDKLVAIISNESDTTNTYIKPKVDSRESTIAVGAQTDTFTGDARPGHDFIRTKKHRVALPAGHTYSVRITDNSTHPIEIEKIVTEYTVLKLSR